MIWRPNRDDGEHEFDLVTKNEMRQIAPADEEWLRRQLDDLAASDEPGCGAETR